MTAQTYAVVPNSLLLDPSLSDGAVRLYAVLLGMRPEPDGTVLATHEQLGEACGHGRRWAFDRVRELADSGCLEWRRGGRGTPNRYLPLDVVPRSRPGPRGPRLVEAETRGGPAITHAAASDVRITVELQAAVEPAPEALDQERVTEAPLGSRAVVGGVGTAECTARSSSHAPDSRTAHGANDGSA